MKDSALNWIKIAKVELRAAESLYNDCNYIKSIEHCHAALEKILKGLITENGQIPAKIHDLLKLASIAIIENIQVEVQDLFDELNEVYMATRYPDEFVEVEKEIGEAKTKEILEKTKKAFKWIEKKIEEN